MSLINTQHGTFKLKLCCAERTGLESTAASAPIGSFRYCKRKRSLKMQKTPNSTGTHAKDGGRVAPDFTNALWAGLGPKNSTRPVSRS